MKHNYARDVANFFHMNMVFSAVVTILFKAVNQWTQNKDGNIIKQYLTFLEKEKKKNQSILPVSLVSLAGALKLDTFLIK